MIQKTIVLSMQPQRIESPAHHILERRIYGNRILGNHVSLETIVRRNWVAEI